MDKTETHPFRSRSVLHRTDPPEDLSSLIESFAGRGDLTAIGAFPVFPIGRAELFFNFGDPIWTGQIGHLRPEPQAFLLGPRSQIYWQAGGPAVDWFLVQLTPLGMRRLLGTSFGECWDLTIDLEQMPSRIPADLFSRMQAAVTFQDRVAICVDAVRAVSKSDMIDAAASAVGSMARRGILRTVDAMGRSLDIGPARLRQRFQSTYGVGPKFFLSLMRFERQLTERHPLLHEPAYHGSDDYFDDSHAIREFKRFTRMTPTKYRSLKANDRMLITGETVSWKPNRN